MELCNVVVGAVNISTTTTTDYQSLIRSAQTGRDGPQWRIQLGSGWVGIFEANFQSCEGTMAPPPGWAMAPSHSWKMASKIPSLRSPKFSVFFSFFSMKFCTDHNNYKCKKL